MRGDNAKLEVIDRIMNCFGEDYVGYIDKKLYVWANDGGERVQICLAMTCPKVAVEAPNPIGTPAPAAKSSTPVGGWFTDNTPAEPEKTATISEEEQNNIAEMLKRLGL